MYQTAFMMTLFTLTNVVISGNSSPNGAGGIYSGPGMLTLINSTVSGNSSGFAGAIPGQARR